MTDNRNSREPIMPLLKVDKSLDKLLCQRIAEFEGDGTVLESALGALVLGQHYGTRALQMMHSPATLKKYQKLLGIQFSDYCPERTQLSTKVRGIKIADKIGGFWKVVMGQHPVKRKHYADE